MENDSILNYYEKLVFDNIQQTLIDTGKIESEDAIQDIACLALNGLPSRYIRHHVDTIFYMPDHEKKKMMTDVAAAVQKAYEIVSTKPRRED